MSIRTTKAQFQVFEREARKWLGKLGLTDWAVQVVHAEIPDESIFADCRVLETNRAACLRMNTRVGIYPETLTVKFIRQYAIHEVLELLLSDCGEIMERAAPRSIADRERHIVIRALEHVLVEVKG